MGGDEEEEQVAYCTDENGEIVDEDYCDDGYNGPGAGFFFLYLGGFGRGLPVGTVLPAVAPDQPDRHRRQRAGLPASGKVSPGRG